MLDLPVTLEPIADGLWHVERDLRLPGGVRLPIRMTVWQLWGGALALCSPVPIDDAIAAALDTIGEVRYLIAPNALHHLHVAAAARRYPAAAIWAAPGVARKQPGLALAGELGDPAAAPWRDHLDQLLIGGAPKINEVVFFHRATRTLICSDLVFHITRPANWRTRLVLRMAGTGGGRLIASRVWLGAVKDRATVRAAVTRILAWDPARIVMAHGEIFEGDGRAALIAALPRVVGRAALAASPG